MTDEEMAYEYAKYDDNGRVSVNDDKFKAFLAGLKAGRPKWHKVADGDLPKDFGYYLVALTSIAYKGFVFEVVYFTGSIFTKEGEISDNVYAWKEIVLPEPSKYWDLSTGENNINKED